MEETDGRADVLLHPTCYFFSNMGETSFLFFICLFKTVMAHICSGLSLYVESYSGRYRPAVCQRQQL